MTAAGRPESPTRRRILVVRNTHTPSKAVGKLPLRLGVTPIRRGTIERDRERVILSNEGSGCENVPEHTQCRRMCLFCRRAEQVKAGADVLANAVASNERQGAARLNCWIAVGPEHLR